MLPPQDIHKPQATTFVVAASDSLHKERADYVCDGVDDQVEIQAAVDALQSGGGKVILNEGTFNISECIERASNNITLEGMGRGTYLNYSGNGKAIRMGTTSGWIIANLKVSMIFSWPDTEDGGIDFTSATDWSLKNVWEGNTHIPLWTYESGLFGIPISKNLQSIISCHPDVHILDSFETDWNVQSGIISYDTNIKYHGTRSMKMVSVHPDAAKADFSVSIDLSNSSFSVWVYTEDYTQVKKLNLYVQTGGNWDNFGIFYFALSTNDMPTVDGKWIKMTASHAHDKTGTPDYSDVSLVRLGLESVAGGAPTIFVDDLRYVKNNLLPNGAITFSFDDGLPSTYLLAKPLLDKYGYPAVWGVNGRLNSTTIMYAKEMQNHGWDIANHSRSHHYAELLAHPEKEVLFQQSYLRGQGLRGAEHFILPGGYHNAAFLRVMDKYGSGMIRRNLATCMESIPNLGTMQKAKIMHAAVTPAYIKTLIDLAKDRHLWLQILFHDIVNSGATGSAYNVPDLEEIVDYCHSEGISVLNYSQVIELIELRKNPRVNSGTSTGTGAQQTIAHGLTAAPTKVILWNIEDGANPYQSAVADGNNIYVLATINQDWGWEAEVV